MQMGSLALGGALALSAPGNAQSMSPPASVVAGAAFSIPTTGSGQATLYIAGPGQALSRTVQLGEPVSIAAGVLYDAGQYVAVLSGSGASDAHVLTVTPAAHPDKLSFLAEPSRLPVALPDGISGAVYVFDAYHNLIQQPMPVAFTLTAESAPTQSRTVNTLNGVAWTRMNSAARQGAAHFVASVGGVTSTRIIDEVPGDPCNLVMSAKPAPGNKIEVSTAPVRDCSGNPIPDGTIVTFTENYNGAQSTVDVPLKKDVAQVEMPAQPGARISVASGVVAGNEIRWEGH